jgi:DNA gyrase subunit A
MKMIITSLWPLALEHDVMLFSDAGKAVRFDENDVRPMGRTARGVRGMNLGVGHQVIAMLVAPAEAAEGAEAAVVDENGMAVPSSVLTATENGFGKRTPIAEYTRHGRGTKGMIAIQTTERNGKVVAASLVSPEDQIMLITTGGILVRTRVSEIREMGRATQGVTLINVDEGTRLSGLQRIAESDSDDEGTDDAEEGDESADPATDSNSDAAGDA